MGYSKSTTNSSPVHSAGDARNIAYLSPKEKRALLAQLLGQKRKREKGEIEIPSLHPRSSDTPNTHQLSFAQQRLWFFHQLEPGSFTYNMPRVFRLSGSLNIKALKRSVNEIVKRHEVLRTIFLVEDGEPATVITPAVDVPLPVTDLREWPSMDREEESQRMATQEAQQPFDLTKDLLLRCQLLQLDTTEHVFLLTMHHIASDEWSIQVFLRELSVLYQAYSTGQSPLLPDLPIQYADFALWQQEWLEGGVIDAQLDYWKGQLANLSPLELPTDRIRPAAQTFNGARQSLLLPLDLSNRLFALGREEGTTVYMTLLAALKTLFYRYTGQEDMTIGSLIAGRTHAKLEGLIGFFVNTLVMRTDLSGDPSFRELLRRVRKMCLATYAHQDLPFEKLVDELKPERDLSRPPLFQVVFNMLNVERKPFELHGLQVEVFSLFKPDAKFDLTLTATSAKEKKHEGIQLRLVYNTDLFEDATIRRMLEHFQTLLAGIVEDPEQRLSDLPILTQAERNQLLVEWNDTQENYPHDQCVHHLFEAQVARTPNATAVLFGDQQLTYGQLNERANQLAHYLQSLGVGPETLVGICVERSVEMIVGLLGILKAGGAYVPFDPTYPKERLAFMLDDTQAPILLTQQRLFEQLPTSNTQVICLDADWKTIAKESEKNLINLANAENLVYVIYTSGSTGQPKGVSVPHKAVNRLIFNTNYINLLRSDCIAQASNASFDAATFEIWGALLHGAKLVGIPRDVALAPHEFVRALRQHKINVLFLTTALFNQIVKAIPDAFASLRCLLFGGEAVDPTSVRIVLEKGAPERLLHVYGPTENTTFSSWYLVEQVSAHVTTIPIGRSISNTQIYLLDANRQPVPIGVDGELYIGGDGLARGYHNRSELTKEKFVENPFGPGRLYRTGDLVRYLPDGNIEFLGRIDNQVKLRGFRIELGEIETALASHPAIRETVVMMREDSPNDKRLVVYIIACQDPPPTVSELRRFLQEKLPEYMVPSLFVFLAVLPLTPNGKVDRNALPAPDLSRPALSETFVAPRTPVEELIAGIWAQVLGVDGVGIEDNFFELGGHSLLATRIVSRLRDTFCVELPLRDLFEAPTVARLAFRVEQAQKEKSGFLVPLIKSVGRNQKIPLSFAQQRLWFLEQLTPGSTAYNISQSARLIGSLNVDALERSLNEIVHRHEVLRTTLQVIEGQPVQVIADALNVNLSVVDLSGFLASEKETEALCLIRESAQSPFDLTQGPLLRPILLQLDETQHIFHLTIHHIVSDGWSTGIFFRELAAFYQAYSTGQSPLLPDLPIQYADFAVWQREWLEGGVIDAQLDYWKGQLADLRTLELPTDRLRPPIQTFNGDRELITLPKALSEQLSDLSRREGTTLYMTLLGAFKTLLYRYTGQDDIAIGSPIAGRMRPEIEELIGFFVNTLVMRTDLSGDPSFRELLGRVREVCLSAYAHQDLPFEKLVDELKPERNLSRSPLFQVMFVLQNTPRSIAKLPGLTMQRLSTDRMVAKFDLTVNISESEDGLRTQVEYNTDLFDAATIQRMLGHFQTLLTGIVENPEQRLSDLPILTQAERNQLLVKWNDTQENYPHDKCLHHLFEEQVARTPNAIAVTFGDQQLTYQELDTQSNQLAHYLQQLGVGVETLVGLYVERSLAIVVGILGILKAGGAYVPLDTAYPPQRLAFMLEDSQASVLLTQSHLVENLPPNMAQVVCLDSDWEDIAGKSTPAPVSDVTPQNLSYVIYTSGSTGKPKGVLVNHANVRRLFDATESWFDFDTHDVWTLFHSHAFDFSVWELWGALLYGGRLVVVTYEISRSPLAFHRLLIEQGVTVLNQTPSAFRQLIQADESSQNSDKLCLRVVIFGGEALELQSLKPWINRHGDEFPQLINMYGITETTVHVTYRRLKAADLDNGSGSVIGRRIPDLQVYLLDEGKQLVPIGIPGEIYVGGAGVARGYLNRPELTDERFVANPFDKTQGERLYKSGDKARYRPDGDLEYLGRIDHQVQFHGFRIELGEIETALASHPAVRETVVMMREDSPNDKHLVAYIIACQHPTPTVSELRRFLQEKLPEYMVPSLFVFLAVLPLTSNGKVDRNALPAPALSRPALSEAFAAPRTPVEELIAGIWTQVLGVDGVGIEDNFFELGGHSLLATRIVSRLRDTFSVELPLRDLFEAPTVAGLACRVEQAKKEKSGFLPPLIKSVSRDRQIPLSFAQQRLWFLEQLTPGSTAYNISQSTRLIGSLNIDALEKSFNEIVHRHEVLRTTFQVIDGQPCQVIADELKLKLEVVNLSELPAAEQEVEAEHRIRDEAKTPFDLTQGPLLRAMLLRLDETEHIFYFTMHHIISDGWSMGIFRQEFATLYEAYSTGKAPSIADLSIQYADFACWQREWMDGEIIETQLDYWKGQLADLVPLELPTDRIRPAIQTFNGAHQSLVLDLELSKKLSALGREEGATLYMTLMAALKTLFYRYTGQDDIAIGSPIAGRTHAQVEGLIGCFLNTLVMRTDLSGDPSFRELLGRVREVSLGAYTHQDVPFEKLLEELQPERDLSRTPLFQVLFNTLNFERKRIKLHGLRFEPFSPFEPDSKFDLTVSAREQNEQIYLRWVYNTDLFEDATITRMLGHFQTLLSGIVAHPELPLSDLPLLTEAERHQLLIEWNDTEKDYPHDECLHHLFEAQVERTPNVVAVAFEDERLTYQELNDRANQLAHYLRQLGVGPDVRVGICVERSIEMVVALLGILKAGGAYVPLSPAYPEARLGFMLSDAQIPVLLTQQRLVASLPDHKAQVICLDTDWKAISQKSEQRPASDVMPGNSAYIIYTSGSTGTPKGVIIPHSAICNRLHWAQEAYPLTEIDRVLQLANLSFDFSAWEIFAPLSAGACLVVPQSGGYQDSTYVVKLIAEQQITVVHFVPSMFQVILEEEMLDACNCLKFVLCGGEALSVDLQERFFARLDAYLFNQYGPTEATIDATFWTCQRGTHQPIVPIGRPIANTQIYLLDHHLNPVPIGVPGELYIGGAGLARGYVRRPDLTAEQFIVNPFSDDPASRLYRTGDLARYLPNGDIEFLGRIDHQVKIRGFRIELGEIEATLLQHPDIDKAVVLAREDDPGDKRLVGYVVSKPESIPSVSEMRRFLCEKLPDYMVPQIFVFLDAIPLMPNGKVDRHALPVPDSSRPELENTFVAPTTSAEKVLTDIWSQLLRLEQVGIHDNFFELGGDSILSIQIIARANEAGLGLTPKQLFQHQTIAELAKIARVTRTPHREQGLVTGRVRLTPIQQRFFEQHLHDPHHFNQSMLLEIQEPLDFDQLKKVMQQLVNHHDALRLRFVKVGSGWKQVNAGPEATMPFTQVDLSEVPTAEQSAAIESQTAELQASLNLSEGPLLRFALFDLGANQPSRLLIIIHHLAVDGVSWRILLEDLQTAYRQLRRSEPIRLPPKTTSFKAWAQQLREYAQSGSLDTEQDYWFATQTPHTSPLPVDGQAKAKANTVASAQRVSVSLTVEETRALLQDVPKAYRTQINDVLLTALVQTFSQWTASQSLLIDLEGHGREEIIEGVDLSRTVGWFTTVFPVHLKLGDVWDPGAALKTIKEQLRSIPNHGIGYGLLRYLSEDDKIAQKVRTLPQAEVIFNYLGQFDQVLSGSALFVPARESRGPNRSQKGLRRYLLEINSHIVRGKFRVIWTYSSNLHHRATIESLADNFIMTLRSLITHCQSPEAGGYTPSDFSLAALSQQQLDKLIKKKL